MNKSLRETGLHGLSWAFASRVGGQAFQLAFSIVLARLLTPEEFGIIGMLLVFTGFAQTLADFGLSSALIQNQAVAEIHRSTAFWLQSAAGLVLCVVFFVGAPYVAQFYSTPVLEPLTRLVSCVFPIQAIGLTHYALLTKEFRFRALAVATFASTIVSGIVAVMLAWRGYGVWALAWQPIIATGSLTAFWWLQSGWRPRLLFGRQAAVQMGSYGIYLLGHATINYWLRNGDKLIIGKLLGSYPLGIYSRAYTLMLLPLNNISGVFGQVMFPVLARMQDDLPRFRRAYLKATQFIALIAFPMMFGLAALSAPIILMLLGEKWRDVIPVFRVLSFVGLVQSIIFPVAWIFTSLGRTKAQFQLSVGFAAAFAVAMGIGVQYGIMGVTYAYAAWTLVAALGNLHVAGGYIGLSAGQSLLAVSRIFLMAAIMGSIVFGTDALISNAWPAAARAGVGTLVGVLSFVALCLVSRDATFAEFVQIAAARLRGRRA